WLDAIGGWIVIHGREVHGGGRAIALRVLLLDSVCPFVSETLGHVPPPVDQRYSPASCANNGPVGELRIPFDDGHTVSGALARIHIKSNCHVVRERIFDSSDTDGGLIEPVIAHCLKNGLP